MGAFNINNLEILQAIVLVEAELGGLKGIEDKMSVTGREAFLTDPQAAEEFAKKTEIDSLAIAIGTSH